MPLDLASSQSIVIWNGDAIRRTVRRMPIGSLNEIVIECANPEALARFWQALIGGEVEVESPEWVVLDGDDEGFFFRFEPATSGRASGSGNRIRLDVDVDDLASATDEAEQLGARKVGGVVDDDDGAFQVMADPGDNPFHFVQS